MAVVSDISAVERLIFDDRIDVWQIDRPLTQEGADAKAWALSFGAKNTASIMEVRGLTLKGEITMMKAINELYEQTYYLWGLFQILHRMCKH